MYNVNIAQQFVLSVESVLQAIFKVLLALLVTMTQFFHHLLAFFCVGDEEQVAFLQTLEMFLQLTWVLEVHLEFFIAILQQVNDLLADTERVPLNQRLDLGSRRLILTFTTC